MSTPAERSRSETLVANERVKAASGTLTNLGTGLLAAAVARMFLKGGVDATSAIWIVAVAALMFSAWKVLHLLDAETDR